MSVNVAIVCPICKCSGRDNWVSISCGHVLHAQCIYEWVERNQSCPLCRKELKKTQQATPLFMDFEHVGGTGDQDIQQLEELFEFRKKLNAMKNKHKVQENSFKEEIAVLERSVETSNLRLQAYSQKVSDLERQSSMWQQRFEKQMKVNGMGKLLADEVTDGEIDLILAQLSAGNCTEFIKKYKERYGIEKQRSQEEYRIVMKKCEDLQKRNQQLELRLAKEQQKSKDANNQLKDIHNKYLQQQSIQSSASNKENIQCNFKKRKLSDAFENQIQISPANINCEKLQKKNVPLKQQFDGEIMDISNKKIVVNNLNYQYIQDADFLPKRQNQSASGFNPNLYNKVNDKFVYVSKLFFEK